ncbi:uncharacterized protein LOC143177555 [Calliopsis andreniformis]|uniref:uncharacterized protein LOC143177555 n=1 Tax=Calliopsis andreniformis TaxID=337506 RepID=UPI003FCE76E6
MSLKFFAFIFVIVMMALFIRADSTTLPPARLCVDGKRYYDGCNWCQCYLGSVACTLRFCPSTDILPASEDFWVHA